MEQSGKIDVRSKIWLEVDGEPVLGGGREELLRRVRQCGSISAAARQMGLPYRKAWTYIDAMEKRLGFPLVHRQKGGAGGGEATLTPEAEDLLARFDRLREGINELVDKKFEEMF